MKVTTITSLLFSLGIAAPISVPAQAPYSSVCIRNAAKVYKILDDSLQGQTK